MSDDAALIFCLSHEVIHRLREHGVPQPLVQDAADERLQARVIVADLLRTKFPEAAVDTEAALRLVAEAATRVIVADLLRTKFPAVGTAQAGVRAVDRG